MFNAEAIEKISESQSIVAARDAVGASLENGYAVVSLPSSFTERDLEKFMPTRRRLRGSMVTSAIADFAKYTESHLENGATIFIDPESMAATGVLNLGSPDSPGHADNISKLAPKRTAAYAALRAIASGNPVSQRSAAEFMEDWIGSTVCYKDNQVVVPNQAIAAIRNLTIEAMRKLESQEQQLSASKSAFESITATSIEPLPTMIEFTCTPYKDLIKRTFTMRLGITTGSDKPNLTLRIIKIEEHEEQMAAELAERIQAAITNKEIEVVIGQYSPTK